MIIYSFVDYEDINNSLVTKHKQITIMLHLIIYGNLITIATLGLMNSKT